MGNFVIAVDVGTASARAGLLDRSGQLLARASHPISIRRQGASVAEYSSDDIWSAVLAAVRQALADSAVDPAEVDAIGFDATCSLVFLDGAGKSLAINPDQAPGWDTIAWLDHRASAEAERLSSSGVDALRYTGGTVSPEMQLPKLMWVKANLPAVWSRTGLILDLADFLTFRATGNPARSASTLVSKWMYPGHEANGWDTDLLADAGLEDLTTRAGIASPPLATGSAVGTLLPEVASALGLSPRCKVSAGMVDAYAGTLALTGAEPDRAEDASLIGGTSSCLMRFSREPHFAPAFWGPFFGAALPDYWISEGGQSAAGALLDLIMRFHLGRDPSTSDHDKVLADIAEGLATAGADFGRGIHVLPDFHGNRTPIGNAGLRGTITGLSLDSSPDAIAALYYRSMVALALSMRQIVERMEQVSGPVRRLVLGGGHARIPLFARLYADAIGREVTIGAGDEAMLLGTAMAAATAAGWHPTLGESCRSMARPPQQVFTPDPAASFDRDYRIFLRMQQQRQELLELG